MSQEEYDKMISTGKVQMSGDNKVHVANPADINAFGKQAPNGSLYVEFDVALMFQVIQFQKAEQMVGVLLTVQVHYSID